MIAMLKQFLDRIKFEGLSPFGRFYGIWKGKVLSTTDNDNQGKIQVAVPEVSGSETTPVANLAYPLDPMFASFPPEVGDWVWVFFEQGDPRFPVYIGHWWSKGERPADLNPPANTAPTKRFFVTESGHRLMFEDKTGSEEVLLEHKNGSFLQIATDGTITVDVSASPGVNIIFKGLSTIPVPLQELATKTSMDTGPGHTHIAPNGLTSGPLGPGGAGNPAALPALGLITQVVKGQ